MCLHGCDSACVCLTLHVCVCMGVTLHVCVCMGGTLHVCVCMGGTLHGCDSACVCVYSSNPVFIPLFIQNSRTKMACTHIS